MAATIATLGGKGNRARFRVSKTCLDAQLNAAIDERVYERRYGEGGIE
jgi:hypothetical protein